MTKHQGAGCFTIRLDFNEVGGDLPTSSLASLLFAATAALRNTFVHRQNSREERRTSNRGTHSCRLNDQPPEAFEPRNDLRRRKLDQIVTSISLHNGALITPPARHRRRHIKHSKHLLLLGLMHGPRLLQMASHSRHNHRVPHPHLSPLVLRAMPLLRDGMLLRLLLLLQSVLPFAETEERGVPTTSTTL